MIIRRQPKPKGAEPLASTLIDVGYIEGTFNFTSSGSLGMAAAFDGVLSKIWNAGALTATQTTDGIIGYDYTFTRPSGMKIDKVEVTSSNNQGFCVSFNPTDVKIVLEGWNGTAWVALGDTGLFTDGTVQVTKTIISTDQVTLFFKFRLVLSTTQNCVRSIAAIKIFEVTLGELNLNFIDQSNITPAPLVGLGRIEEMVNGILHPLAADSTLSPITTSDFIVPINFDTARVIEKAIIYASSNGGYFSAADPIDVQIDLEGWNGVAWVPLGNTGIFADANNLEKTIFSSDQVTLFTKARVLLSSASSANRIYSQIEIYTLL